MSCRRLLSLLCLSVVPLLLVSLTLANGALTVDEDNITVRFDRDSTAIVLPINNGSSVTPCILRLELLNPDDHIITSAEQRITIQRGKQRVSSNLAFSPSSLKAQARRSLLWFRLHYQVINCADKSLTDGIVSLSQITRDLFDIRVGMPLLAREDMRYRVRVQAVHPVTLKPANNVNLDGILTLETDVNDLQLHASGITDSKGYAVLTFDLPSRFPTFPHELRAAGGSIKITGRRAGLVAEAEHDVLVDQFARIILSTDKPLYQPGQVLHLRALAFSPTRHALTNQKAIFKITDSEETLIFRGIATTSRFGIASIDWSIPENIRLGEYDVQVAFGESEDSSKTSTRVRVSRYDLPNFKVITRADRAYYIPGQKAEVKVTAQYLFGQPVTRGHVRVVRETERKWNYEKQKWDIEEGQSYEGETDNNGSFSAQIDLSHEAADLIDEDSRFKDVTYAAYFTEPTANRTEQHRFDLRVTKEPIHVYLIDTENLHNAAFPLRFFVSTFYANGEPAPCQVIVNATDQDKESFKVTRRIRTNRFGLARVSFPAFGKRERDGDIAIKLSASDRKRNRGTKTEEYWLEKNSGGVQIATDK